MVALTESKPYRATLPVPICPYLIDSRWRWSGLFAARTPTESDGVSAVLARFKKRSRHRRGKSPPGRLADQAPLFQFSQHGPSGMGRYAQGLRRILRRDERTADQQVHERRHAGGRALARSGFVQPPVG